MEDFTHYKKQLEEERDRLASELNDLGVQDTTKEASWDLKQPDIDVLQADQNEAADKTEEAHIDSIVLNELTARYRLVLRALAKFEAGTYGVCEISGETIEQERLDANPAARTCKGHPGEADKRTN